MSHLVAHRPNVCWIWDNGRDSEADESGLVAVSWTITAPVLLIFMMLVVQGALWWHAQQSASAAAAEAVDEAQLLHSTAADGEAAAQGWLEQAGNLTNITVAVDRSEDQVTATVQGDAPQLIPGWDWGVTAVADGPVERFIVEADR